jgi:hypothetical protein
MLTPSASSTSALPDLLTTRRARRAWPPGAGRGGDEHGGGGDVEGVGAVAAGADDVDQVRGGGTGTLVDNSRITCAAAAISPMVSFLTRRPVRMAAVITGDISPP